MTLFQRRFVHPAQQFGRADELFGVVRAFRHHAQHILRAHHRHQPGFGVAVKRGEKDVTAGLHELCTGLYYRARVRHVFEHLHAGHNVIGTGILRGVLFHGLLNVGKLNAAFQRVQTRHCQRLGAHIEPRDVRPFARHALRENAAAAADIQHLFPEQTAGALGNIAKTQRVNAMQRFKFPFSVPPARSDSFKFGDFF